MQFPIQKFKVQLRLAIQRLRLYQAKQESLNAKARRDIAGLLEAGKTASARIRVEGIIREDFNIEAMELVELSCELLTARIGLIEQARALDADDGVSEAAASIIYASTRLDVKELVAIRELLVTKYGKDAVLRAIDGKDANVSPRLLLKLSVQAPPQELVSSYLKEIAAAYSIAWRPEGDDQNSSESDGGSGGGPPSGAVAQLVAETKDGVDETLAAETKETIEEQPVAMEEETTLPDPDPEKQPGAEDSAQPEGRDTECLPYVPQRPSRIRRGMEDEANQKSAVAAAEPAKKTPKGKSPVAGPAVSKVRSRQADDGLPSLEELQQRFEALKRP
ncbi:Vacuolar protein sorting-associated protein ist1 [Coemansia sp. RSA 1813]|nr:Vacuolar protein sorting-associated protein ist1 [Coemansia sp. RSA 1646]KAJ1765832.1 Vacuolar protein sorting-associated protein ist1 [Coemansia sp. RSA 1843]KAJ2085490.1 Vacuolar protein sorting-associated protein ist1 [Coemansia sp. RSA 986]KAJ2216430.1 Vacuolar protein sorting-associated protein ist1 [Coemansia sp. RSA 487]KAJ2562728.1 Vacuolar protein sorting-associated protein ist1 [Coemansia sp. RSA 1813]